MDCTETNIAPVSPHTGRTQSLVVTFDQSMVNRDLDMLQDDEQLAQPSTLTQDDRLASYLRNVLCLPDGATEQEWDHALRTRARELGIDGNAEFERAGKDTPSSRRCSQDSSLSKTSRSTGLTSNPSERRYSFSIREYDAFLSRGVPIGGSSMSFSPPTTPTTPSLSAFSLPLASPESPPKRHFRVLRGLSLLGLNRNGSTSSLPESCPHCPANLFSQRRARHRLACGHKICTQALRETIKSATENRTGAIPSCCGMPIPGTLIESVASHDEQNALLEKLEQWDSTCYSRRASLASERRDSLAASLHKRALNTEPTHTVFQGFSLKRDPLTPLSQRPTSPVFDHQELRTLRATQTAQHDRFQSWLNETRTKLETNHAAHRTYLSKTHSRALANLGETHDQAIADLEDEQVLGEADIRAAQAQERDFSIAGLRNIQAYCAGRYLSNGEPHFRPVTPRDHEALEAARRDLRRLEARHASAIDVLRGEQERRMRARMLKKEDDVAALVASQKGEVDELERRLGGEVVQVERFFEDRGRALRGRWGLERAVSETKLGLMSDAHVVGMNDNGT